MVWLGADPVSRVRSIHKPRSWSRVMRGAAGGPMGIFPSGQQCCLALFLSGSSSSNWCLFLLFVYALDRVLLCSPSWSGTLSRASLQLCRSICFCIPVLGLKVCFTMTGTPSSNRFGKTGIVFVSFPKWIAHLLNGVLLSTILAAEDQSLSHPIIAPVLQVWFLLQYSTAAAVSMRVSGRCWCGT